MTTADRKMLGFAHLGVLAHRRGQIAGAGRFLVLAGVAACHAGCLEVAADCRSVVVADNERHLLRRYPSLPDALRDADFEPFLRSLERQCPWEQSEHVLSELGVDLDLPDGSDFADAARRILAELVV